jgi:hypothetical protein
LNESLKYLKSAAEFNESAAYATLGYIAYEIEKNKTKASIFWLKGYQIDRNIDCAHNLGFLWSNGHYMNYSRDLVK